ncbi:MAG TPA: hypothetical protein VLM39_06755 [Ignavibacteriaceae bacterium]|nr:hypothetical protein [Ignavibacteriaceae bacterium]
MNNKNNILNPQNWGLNIEGEGELYWNNFKLTSFAKEFGTPLYIINEDRLFTAAENFKAKVKLIFGEMGSVYYPFKCNSVPAVINVIKKSDISAEVMTEFELKLALKIGFVPNKIIVNGPCKTEKFLKECFETRVKLIIIDSVSELLSLTKIAEGKEVKILLRVNPDVIPKGLYRGSATGSKASWFGMDGFEVLKAIEILKQNRLIKFQGIHFHIGTGLREPQSYTEAIKKLYPLFHSLQSSGFKIKIIDVGGGFASMTTRELSPLEMIALQISSKYMLKWGKRKSYNISDFLTEIKKAVHSFFIDFPEIFFEPGRCIVSPNQLLLLTVIRIKQRGDKKWLITDGGLGTVTMPTYYEYHEMFLCNNANRVITDTATITGPCCFASDIIYKNKPMPKVKEGEVLALMDCGAYFNALESSFNFPKPGIVSIHGDSYSLARRKESFNEMFVRDNIKQYLIEEVQNEILCR